MSSIDRARERAVILAATLAATRANLDTTDTARVTRHARRVLLYGRSPAWAASCAAKLAAQLAVCNHPVTPI